MILNKKDTVEFLHNTSRHPKKGDMKTVLDMVRVGKNVGYQIMDKHFEKAVEDGNDPSPKDIEEIQQAIINHQIAFFVDNSQTSDKVVDNLVKLAHEHDVPVLKVTETKPNGDDYMQWMLKQYQVLSRIQQKEN